MASVTAQSFQARPDPGEAVRILRRLEPLLVRISDEQDRMRSDLTGFGARLITVEQSVKTIEYSVSAVEQSAKTLEQGVKTIEQSVKTVEQGVKTVEQGVKTVEQSIKMLEQGLLATNSNLRAVELNVARIDGRVSQLPTTWQLVVGLSGLIGFMLTLSHFLATRP